MMGVAATGAVLAVIAAVAGVQGPSSRRYLVVGAVTSYATCLLLLLLIARAYLKRSQFLALVAISTGVSALVIQSATSGSESVRMLAVLSLPIVPFSIALVLGRNTAAAEPAPAAETSETLSTLVRSRRDRGLQPQVENLVYDEYQLRLQRTARRRAVAIVVVLALSAVLLTMRLYHHQRALIYDIEEQRCLNEVAKLEGQIVEIEEQPSLSDADRQLIAADRRVIAQWKARAEWHARRRRAHEGRWW
jgi:hypothetical protein